MVYEMDYTEEYGQNFDIIYLFEFSMLKYLIQTRNLSYTISVLSLEGRDCSFWYIP